MRNRATALSTAATTQYPCSTSRLTAPVSARPRSLRGRHRRVHFHVQSGRGLHATRLDAPKLPSERADLGVESRMLRSTVAEFANLIQVTPSTGYGILARVLFEPTCAAGEQLVDLGLADPVALAVFGDGEEHVDVV